MDRRQIKALERRVRALSRAESAVLERLVDMRDELERLICRVHRLTFPPRRKRRSAPLPPGVVSLKEARERR